jgi:hypothetical protein
MAMLINDTVRSAMAYALVNAIDAAASPGKILCYTAMQPAKGGAATTLLASMVLNKPCAVVNNGVITFEVIPEVSDASADESGTVAWCRVEDGDGNFVYDGNASLESGDGSFKFKSLDFATDIKVVLISAVLTVGA